MRRTSYVSSIRSLYFDQSFYRKLSIRKSLFNFENDRFIRF